AIPADVFDLDAFVKFSRDPIESLVRLLFREESAAPLEELNQRAPKVFVLFTGALPIRVEAGQEFGKRFSRERRRHSAFTLKVGPLARLDEAGPVVRVAAGLVLKHPQLHTPQRLAPARPLQQSLVVADD